MNSRIASGRARRSRDKGSSRIGSAAGGSVMLIGVGICTLFLMLSLSSAPADNIKLNSASTAVMSKLSENEAVAVFLGLDVGTISGGAVPASTDPEKSDSGDVYIDCEDKSWSLWSYLSDTLGKLFSPLLQ